MLVVYPSVGFPDESSLPGVRPVQRTRVLRVSRGAPDTSRFHFPRRPPYPPEVPLRGEWSLKVLPTCTEVLSDKIKTFIGKCKVAVTWSIWTRGKSPPKVTSPPSVYFSVCVMSRLPAPSCESSCVLGRTSETPRSSSSEVRRCSPKRIRDRFRLTVRLGTSVCFDRLGNKLNKLVLLSPILTAQDGRWFYRS